MLTASAGQMTFSTAAEPGTAARILLNTTSATFPVTIDWGNGIDVQYTVDPSMAAYNRWIEGSIEGETIIIKGNITEVNINNLELTSAVIEDMVHLQELDLANNSLSSFALVGITPLTDLNLSYNDIVNGAYDNPTLSLENAGATLTTLNISHNSALGCLDIRDLEVLEYLSLNDNPRFGSIFICMPEESRPALRSINISNCDLAHFYPVSLPNLRTLNLSNNSLMTSADDEPFVLGSYPALTTIDVSHNKQVKALDLTGCTKLENINISGNQFTTLDVAQAPDLQVLYATDNNIGSFDLGNNKALRTLNIAGNPVKELDLTVFPSLTTVDISRTGISRVTLTQASYLQEFKAAETNIEFIDFNGQQAERMRLIDLRNNKKMTGETVTYTLKTLPQAKTTTYDNGEPNLLLEGSNAETADTDYATSSDMQWKCDVKGDGTARNYETDVNLVGATHTGENKTGHIDRLYPIFAMGMDYDFDVYSTTGGEFLIAQWQPVYFQSMKSVSDKAYVGVPVYVYPYPEEGKRFKSVTVNGKEIFSQWFVIDGPSDIRVNFTNAENSISFTTVPGQSLSLIVNTVEANGTIWIDWGTGTRTEYAGQNKYTTGYVELGGSRIDGSAAAETVTIYGDVAGLDVSGFGDTAEYFGLWDNAITSIDLSNAADLKLLNAYWNPIKTIDLSGAPGLEVLDLSFTALKKIDLSNNPNIMWLEAYGDGYGDEDEGMALLTEIDVTGLPYLQYLDVKGNELTSLDVSKNPYLIWLRANNNSISSIDLSANTRLEELELSRNRLSKIDLSNNTELISLAIENNSLTEIDLSANTALKLVMIGNNDIHAFDASALTSLSRLYINGNGMTADELNDLYYLLPQRAATDDDSTQQLGWNLAVIQGTDKVQNDGNRADSSIAVDRGWTPTHTGSNGGSDFAYLDILSSPYGSVKVTDENGTEYAHGSKVPKYTTLTITPEPKDGYTLTSFRLNNEAPMTGLTFTMPGIYTKLAPTFAAGSLIENTQAEVSAVRAAKGMIAISGKATADIFAADGRHIVAAAYIDGESTFEVTPGIYVVRIADANGARTVKIAVR